MHTKTIDHQMDLRHMIKAASYRFLAPTLVLLIAGCGSDDSNYDFETSRPAAEFQQELEAVEEARAEAAAQGNPQALFSPSPTAPVLPFPINLAFNGSDDGTLNFPIADPAERNVSNPQFVLNQLDGFSTISPITTAVSKPLDLTSLRLGDTVRVFEVTTLTQPAGARAAVLSAVTEITDPTVLAVTEVNNQIILQPIEPLKPATSYMVALTDGIQDQGGLALQASLVYGLLKSDAELADPNLANLRSIVNTHLNLLSSGFSVDTDTVVLSWVFTTQSTREVLQAVKDNTTPSTLELVFSELDTEDADPRFQGKADVFVGALDVPYYLQTPADNGDPTPALNGFWENADGKSPGAINGDGNADYMPVKTADVKIPVIMTVPNENSAGGGVMPPNGWPVTIYQHGLTDRRISGVALGDAFADAGRVVIGIDLPMHGVIDDTDPTHASRNPLGTTERTFNIDVVTIDPQTGAQIPGPDGQTDPSGTHFFNLQNLANTRDNLRQGIADLFVLKASLPNALIRLQEGTETGDRLDASDVTFVGHSLGGIVGTTMLSFENDYRAATLGMPGSGIAGLLTASETIGPRVNGALANGGLEPGSPGYNRFVLAAQTIIDSADPANHASTLVEQGNTRIHFIEVIGDNTVPNRVDTAPLSGSEPLIRLLNLPSVDATVVDSNAAVRFTAGDHASLLDNTASEPATIEMQTQTAGFAASSGTRLEITNQDVIQPVEQ